MPKFLLRLISFPSKEIWEVLRQPRLVLSLILGPFMLGVVFLLKPLVVALNFIANMCLKLMKIEPKDEVASTYSHDEVAGLVEESRREGLLDDRVRPRQRLDVVRADPLLLDLALVAADLALDLGDAEIDRRVHVLGRLVARDGEAVVELEVDVDAVVVALRREHDVAPDGIRHVLADAIHALARVALEGVRGFHVPEHDRELHLASEAVVTRQV